MKTSKKLKYRYSGKKSKDFWNIVNSLNEDEQNEMYTLGVLLQNTEEVVLRRLSEINNKHNEPRKP